MIVVDGLDEAPNKTIKELFRLLEDLAHTAQVRPPSLLCDIWAAGACGVLSSRNYRGHYQ
jgi:hypothetical protein